MRRHQEPIWRRRTLCMPFRLIWPDVAAAFAIWRPPGRHWPVSEPLPRCGALTRAERPVQHVLGSRARRLRPSASVPRHARADALALPKCDRRSTVLPVRGAFCFLLN